MAYDEKEVEELVKTVFDMKDAFADVFKKMRLDDLLRVIDDAKGFCKKSEIMARISSILIEDFYSLVDASRGPITYIGRDGKKHTKDLYELQNRLGAYTEKLNQ